MRELPPRAQSLLFWAVMLALMILPPLMET